MGTGGEGTSGGNAEDLLRDLHRELFGDPVVWFHKGDPQEQCPQLAWFFDVWQEDDKGKGKEKVTKLSDRAKVAADAAGVPHGVASQVLAQVSRQRCQDRGLVTFLLQDPVDPDLDPVDPKDLVSHPVDLDPMDLDLDPMDLHLDFEQVKLLALANDKDSEEKQQERQQREREKEERQQERQQRQQQREREKELHIERKLTELRANAENDPDAKTRVLKLAKLATMATVNQRLRGLLQRLLEGIPNGRLQHALRPSMSSPTTLRKLCDEYHVDTSGLFGEGVFAELKSVYKEL